MEIIVGVVHLIDPEHGLEAAFVETGVVRNQRESLDERLYLFPDIGESEFFKLLYLKVVNV